MIRIKQGAQNFTTMITTHWINISMTVAWWINFTLLTTTKNYLAILISTDHEPTLVSIKVNTFIIIIIMATIIKIPPDSREYQQQQLVRTPIEFV